MRGTIRTLFALLVLAAPAGLQAQTFGSGDGYNFSVNASDTNTITIIGYDRPGEPITIRTNFNGLTVSGIGIGGTNDFFANTGVTIVVIPGSVLSIGAQAFADTYLTSVIFPGSVTSLGDRAFGNCLLLTRVFFTGNAPTADSTVFVNPNFMATAYYLSGTTGWAAFSSNAGVPSLMLTEMAEDLEEEAGKTRLEERLAAVMAVALARLLREAEEAPAGAERTKMILDVARRLSQLRRDGQQAERVRMERERWEQKKEDIAEKEREEAEERAQTQAIWEQTKAEFPALRRLDELTAAGTPPKENRVRQSLTLPGRQERGSTDGAPGESDQIQPGDKVQS